MYLYCLPFNIQSSEASQMFLCLRKWVSSTIFIESRWWYRDHIFSNISIMESNKTKPDGLSSLFCKPASHDLHRMNLSVSSTMRFMVLQLKRNSSNSMIYMNFFNFITIPKPLIQHLLRRIYCSHAPDGWYGKHTCGTSTPPYVSTSVLAFILMHHWCWTIWYKSMQWLEINTGSFFCVTVK